MPGRAEAVRAAVGSALGAAAALVVTTALIAEIAAQATAASGISSSTWTPTTAVTAAVFGSGAFHGSLEPAAVLAGWALIGLASVLAGVPGAGLIVYSLGWAPHPLAAALLGAAWGLACQIVVINLLLNWLQADDAVYRALPSWGWWVGMGAWGATLGLLLARRGRALAPAVERGAAAA